MRIMIRRLIQSLVITMLSVVVFGCSAYAANFDATVPASLPISVSADGTVTTATNAVIHNYGSSPILVSSINVSAENGWSLATKDSAASASLGTKVISMGFNGSWIDASGVVDTSGFASIASSSTLNLSYDVKVPGVVVTESTSTAATATFVVGFPVPTMAAGSSWYKSAENRNTITKITFMDSYTPTTAADETWNADVNNTGDIKCYRTGTEIIIAGNGSGKIKANTNSSYMFSYSTSNPGFSKLTSIENLSLLDTSQVVDMNSMFSNCTGLTRLNLSGFNTSQVTSMSGMFFYCSGLTSLDLSGFDTSQVTDMGAMFRFCRGLTSLDLSRFDTSQVTDMGAMFLLCNGLTSLDLSGFNTSQVIRMDYMFAYCVGLTTIYASGKWNTGKVTYRSNMFIDCVKLKGTISYDSSKTDATYANWGTGYLTYKATTTKTLSLNIDPNTSSVTSYDVLTAPISRFRSITDWSDTANVA